MLSHGENAIAALSFLPFSLDRWTCKSVEKELLKSYVLDLKGCGFTC